MGGAIQQREAPRRERRRIAIYDVNMGAMAEELAREVLKAKDRYARMKRGEQSDRKAPKPGEKRKWNVCKICFQPAKGHSCTGPL